MHTCYMSFTFHKPSKQKVLKMIVLVPASAGANIEVHFDEDSDDDFPRSWPMSRQVDIAVLAEEDD